jgi:hypothetical protein
MILLKKMDREKILALSIFLLSSIILKDKGKKLKKKLGI